MKKTIFILLLFSVLLLDAHAPKAIELSFNVETGALSVTVLHRVSDQDKHFIQKIEIYSGKELLAERSYERQGTAAAQEDIFLFIDKPLVKGTPVTVTAHCNISGQKSADLIW